MGRTNRIIVAVISIALIAFCAYRIIVARNDEKAHMENSSNIISFKPAPPTVADTAEPDSATLPVSTSQETPTDEETEDVPEEPIFFNQEILDLQSRYKDAVGWITVPHTGIDYPFVQGADNDFYLNHNMDGEETKAGAIFMDFRNYRDLYDSNIILYGHNMKNGTMFGGIKQYLDKGFFEANNTGTVFLADRTCDVEFFALLVIPSVDGIIYGMNDSEAAAAAFLEHMEEVSRYYRDIGATPNDMFITLSTCAYEFKDARMVLIGLLSERRP